MSVDYGPAIDLRQESGEQPRFVTAATTEASFKHLEQNEDAFFISQENGIIALSDGAGGHAAGAKMSQEVMRLVAEGAPYMTGRTLSDLNRVMSDLAHFVIERGEKFSAHITPEGRRRAMATLIMAKLVEFGNGYHVIIKSIGDSVAYVIRADGRREKVGLPEDDLLTFKVLKGEISKEEAALIAEAVSTVDFSVELIARGLGTEAEIRAMLDANLPELAKTINRFQKIRNRTTTEDRILRLAKIIQTFKFYYPHQRGMVTQSVGVPKENLLNNRIDIHTVVIPNLQQGDRLVLFSDGVSDNLTHSEIVQILGEEAGFQKQLENLRQAAAVRARSEYHLRAQADDITAVGIEVPATTVEAKPRMSIAERWRLAERKTAARQAEAARIAQVPEALARALEIAE